MIPKYSSIASIGPVLVGLCLYVLAQGQFPVKNRKDTAPSLWEFTQSSQTQKSLEDCDMPNSEALREEYRKLRRNELLNMLEQQNLAAGSLRLKSLLALHEWEWTVSKMGEAERLANELWKKASHCHLSGLITLQTLVEVLQEKRIKFIYPQELIISYHESSDWVFEDRDSAGNMYFVERTPIKKNESILAWIKIVSEKGPNLPITKKRYEFDCTLRKMKLLTTIRYDGKGNVIEEATEKRDWQDIDPGSLRGQILKSVCGSSKLIAQFPK